MTPRSTLTLLLTLAALALSAAPAMAQAVLFSDDGEGALEDKWTAGAPSNTAIQPWQKSDSGATKVRGNQANGGATSYWAGSQPQDFQPAEVVEGEATMTTKQGILIPADGKTTISFFSLFQNEGDDQGLLEAAVDTGAAKPAWKKVAQHKLNPGTTGGPYEPGYCDPTHPAETMQEGFVEVKGDFAAYAGQKVLIRFNMKYGGENRVATQPCGWYVDDIKLTTTGTPGLAAAAAPPPAPPTTVAPKPTVKFGALKGKGKRVTLSLTVSGSNIKNATLTLLKGSRKLGTTKAASLSTGTKKVTFKLKKAIKKGAYKVRIAGTAVDGSAFRSSGSARLK